MMQRAIMMKKIKDKNVIIALKTLATEFRDGGKMEDNIEEMTSFFFLPLCVTRTGKLCMPVEGKIPWIPREYLRPMEDPLLAVGDGEKYDEFLEHTTNERYQLDSWQDYLAYAIKLYEFVAEIPLKVTTLEMEMNCLKQMADIICFRIRQLMLLFIFCSCIMR